MNRVQQRMNNPYIHDAAHEQILLKRYEQFSMFSTMLRFGDTQTVWDNISGILDSIHEVNRRYTPEEENQYQTFARLISVNVILSMACHNTGVHPLYIHSVSRRFDKEIAHCPIEGERELTRQMVESYCKLIRNAHVEHYGEFSDRIIRILLSSLTNPPSLGELAKQMYVSSATVTRRFKKETGQTIPEFLNRTRIRVAKLYMQQNDMNLGEIAQAVGFCDASYFSKVFLRYTGLTPTAYLHNG